MLSFKYFLVGFVSGVAAGIIRKQTNMNLLASYGLSMMLSIIGTAIVMFLSGCSTYRYHGSCGDVCFDNRSTIHERWECGCDSINK